MYSNVKNVPLCTNVDRTAVTALIITVTKHRCVKLLELVFGQRICEDFGTSLGVLVRTNPDPVYALQGRKTQHLKNSTMPEGFVMKMILSNRLIPVMSDTQKFELTQQILRLWEQFKTSCFAKQRDIQRKDRRCFVVGVLFSLHKGLCSYDSKEYIIMPHTQFVTRVINKKKNYVSFKVSDITEGQKIIKEVFSGFNATSPLTLNIYDCRHQVASHR